MGLNDTEKALFNQLREKGVDFANPSWEDCRNWLNSNDWKINVLSDYPQGEVRFTVRQGFQRIELIGRSDLEVMGKAILEVTRRKEIENS